MASRTVLPIIRRARAGDAASQFQLGSLYLDGGEGLAANIRAALLWLDRAANQGYADAWRLIGQRILPEFADGAQKLMRWYEVAANDGCAPAQTKLAQLLLSDAQVDGGAGRAETAIGLLRSAAAQGDAIAQTELGVRLLKEQHCGEGNADEAVAWLERAHAAGQARAARPLADHYWLTGTPELARLWYSRCVDLRDVELCYRFGLLSALLGESGVVYLERAAAAGHLLACEELGLRCALGCRDDLEGELSTRNFKKSVRWLQRAASLGSAKACFFLALLYDHQNCSFRSRSRAREWMLEAADRGHPEAQYRMGLRLLRDASAGRECGLRGARFEEPDLAAIRFLADAERQGHVQAAQALDAAACRAPMIAGPQAALWDSAVTAMTPLSLPVARRIDLARVLGLRVCEMLVVDPVAAHRGDCFVVDLRRAGIRSRRRVVLIEHQTQREAVEKAKSLFAVSNPLPGDLLGDYPARYGKLTRLCARAGISLQLFRPRAADISSSLHTDGEPSAGSAEPLPPSLRLAR